MMRIIILGSILGSPYFGKVPYSERRNCRSGGRNYDQARPIKTTVHVLSAHNLVAATIGGPPTLSSGKKGI